MVATSMPAGCQQLDMEDGYGYSYEATNGIVLSPRTMAPSDVTSGGGGGDDGRGTDSTGFGSCREGPKSAATTAGTISRNSLLEKEVAGGIARRSVLVIGGTQFIGRATVELLLHDRSLDVTLLNRGVSPCAFPTVDYDTGKRFRSSASDTGNEGHDGRQSTQFVRLIKCDRRDPQARRRGVFISSDKQTNSTSC
eukprot:2821113-Pleurochrysis_carterae.AAC.2